MINLARLATEIENLPMDLEHVRDIEEFDGPLLSEFRAPNGETFLYSWCDRDELLNRWIVVRTPLQIVCRYLVGGMSLRRVITECRDGFVYIVELDGEAEPKKVWFIRPDNLPAEYVPGENSYHRRDTNTESGFQDVFVGEKWGHDELLGYPNKYLDAYALHAVFGPGAAVIEDPGGTWLDYHMTKGWIFHTAFHKLRAKGADDKRGSLTAMGVSSPGFFRFKVDAEVAAGLRQAVVAYMANRTDIDRLCNEMSSWANSHLQMAESAVRERINWVCTTLGINGNMLMSRISTTHAAAKLMASYVDRLSTLGRRDASKSAMLVGLPPRIVEPERTTSRGTRQRR